MPIHRHYIYLWARNWWTKIKKWRRRRKRFGCYTPILPLHSTFIRLCQHTTQHTHNPMRFIFYFIFYYFFFFFNIWSAMTDHMCCRAWMTQSCISLPGHPLNSRKFVFTTINIVNVLAQGKHNKKTPLNFTFKDIITHEQDIAHWKWRLWLSDKTMIIRRNLTERR